MKKPEKRSVKQRASATTSGRPRSEVGFARVCSGAQALPVVTNLDHIDQHDGQRVRVRGTFIEVDARMRPIEPRQYIGHVSVVLADQTHVSLLPIWHKDALRPQSEIDEFKDQAVEVVGMMHRHAPTDPSGGASPIDPCLTDIQAIWLAPGS